MDLMWTKCADGKQHLFDCHGEPDDVLTSLCGARTALFQDVEDGEWVAGCPADGCEDCEDTRNGM